MALDVSTARETQSHRRAYQASPLYCRAAVTMQSLLQVFQFQPISVDADFFRVGGNSLLAGKVISRQALHFFSNSEGRVHQLSEGTFNSYQ